MVPLLAPREPPTASPPGCVLGRARWAGEVSPTLQPMAAPGLQPTPQGQGLETHPWPLERGSLDTGSLETRSLHGGLGQGPPARPHPGPGSSRAQCRLCPRLRPATPTQCGAWRARKSKRVTRVAAMPRGQARPSATWPAEPSCRPRRPAAKHGRGAAGRRTPAGPWPLHRGGQLGVWRQSSYQPPWTRRLPLGFHPRKVGREGPQHLT